MTDWGEMDEAIGQVHWDAEQRARKLEGRIVEIERRLALAEEHIALLSGVERVGERP